MKIFGQIRRAGNSCSPERGYVLITLVLLVALIALALLTVLPSVKFETRRDREEEMIHRGVQYSRAIRTYYKKFGRYPTRIEELESSNNLRFLRKRYKDPMNCRNSKCEDFKLLHFGEVKLTFSGGLGGATNLNGGQPLTGLNPAQNGPGFGVSGGGFGASAGGFGASTGGFGSSGNQPNASATPKPDAATPTDANAAPNADDSSSSKPSSTDQLAGQTFGGGPVVGVVSASKKDGIREFNRKRKYSEWQFIYDPATDRGGLMNTPNQPPIQGFQQQNGIQQPGVTSSGPIPGMQNNPGYPGQTDNGQPPAQPAQPSQPNQQ